MAIDPSIPLQFRGVDVGSILERAQQMRQRRMEMDNQRYQMDRRKSDDRRNDDYRSAIGDILTGNGSFTTQVPGAESAGDRAARADPEAYLQFQGKQLGIKAGQLKAYRDLNDTAMQLLGGVSDQATYDRAKTAAKVLYQRYGEDPSAIDQLPPQYSPEVVKSLQMQGMDAAHQLQAVARENKLNWDEYDDQADNARADQRAQSMDAYRRGQLANSRREQDLVDARTRRGQDLSSADRKAAIDQRREAAKNRPSGKAVSAGDGAIIRNPKTGQRMTLKNGQWVAIP